MKQGNMPIDELRRLYGDMSLADFVNEAIKHGLVPLDFTLLPRDELKERPQHTNQIQLSCQNYLAS